MNLRKRLRQDTGYNLLQTGFLQVTGVVTFFFTSRFLEKADYGALNWALALSTMITALSGLGLDQLITHRIAAASNSGERRRLFSAHFFHTLLAGGILAIGGGIAAVLGKNLPPFFLTVYFSTLFIYLASSFKVAFAGRAAFKPLATIAIAGGFVKMAGIPILWALGIITAQNVALIWLLSGMVEMGTSLFAGARTPAVGLAPKAGEKQYTSLLRAASPLFLALLFDTALSRIDWVLLGLLSNNGETANYAFAYKIFELSKLPLLIAAPLFLPYLAKTLQSSRAAAPEASPLPRLLSYLLVAGVLLPLGAALIWTPVMETISKGKYGKSNLNVFLLLALCAPLHYISNFYYFKATALNRYKTILAITAGVALLNVALNLVFIPRWGGEGAAGAFLVASALQALLYLGLVRSPQISIVPSHLLLPLITGSMSYAIAVHIGEGALLKLCTGVGCYVLLSVFALTLWGDFQHLFRKE